MNEVKTSPAMNSRAKGNKENLKSRRGRLIYANKSNWGLAPDRKVGGVRTGGPID